MYYITILYIYIILRFILGERKLWFVQFVQVIADERSGYDAATDPASLFTRYVNICPRQKSRTIRH